MPFAVKSLPDPPLERVRVDKWLWAARMFKTRSLATAACDAGHVKLNGSSVKASKAVKRGDHIEVVTPGGLRILDVIELLDKRGPATLAQQLFDDQTPPPPPKEERDITMPRRDRGEGRPTKRDRRALDRLLRAVRGPAEDEDWS